MEAETGAAVGDGDDLCVADIGFVFLGNQQGTQEIPERPLPPPSDVSQKRRRRARTFERARPLAI